jgi:alkylhydroperoxidase family enzyme
LGPELVEAVYADRTTAAVSEQVRAALGFIEIMTLRPDDLSEADADAVRAAGVSDDALDQAAQICALFNVIDRLADAFAFHVPEEADLNRAAEILLKSGYVIPAPMRLLARG